MHKSKVHESFLDYIRDFDYNDPEYYTKPEEYLRNYMDYSYEEIDDIQLDHISETFNSHVTAII